MGLIKNIKIALDPINRRTPGQIVRSIPAVWARVPICICAGYFENKTTSGNKIDSEAILLAIAGTDVQVYGRNPDTVCREETFLLAESLYSHTKDGTEEDKLEDATLALLMSELTKGGANLSTDLATKSADLGFAEISKPLISKLLRTGFPPSENIMSEIIQEAMQKALNIN